MNDFARIVDRLIKARQILPTKVAVLAVKFSKERFRDQAWLDSTRQAWEPRKKKRQGGKKRSQTLLVDTGRLKRSIRKISVSQSLVVIGTDVPYAQIHNDGGVLKNNVNVKSFTKKSHSRKAHTRSRKGTTQSVAAQTVSEHKVNAHTRKMNTTIKPRRFIGNSQVLANDIEKLLVQEFENAMLLK